MATDTLRGTCDLKAVGAFAVVVLLASSCMAGAVETVPPVSDSTIRLRLKGGNTLFSDATIRRDQFDIRGPDGIWPIGEKALVTWRLANEDWRLMLCWPGGHADEIARSWLAPTVLQQTETVAVCVPRGKAADSRLGGMDVVCVNEKGVVSRSSISFPEPIDPALLSSMGLLPHWDYYRHSWDKSQGFKITECLLFPLEGGDAACAVFAREGLGRRDGAQSISVFLLTLTGGKWTQVQRATDEGSSAWGRRLYDLAWSSEGAVLQWIEADAIKPEAARIRHARVKKEAWESPTTIYEFSLAAPKEAFSRVSSDGSAYLVDRSALTIVSEDGFRQISAGTSERISDVLPAHEGFGPLVVLHPVDEPGASIFYDLSGRLPMCVTPAMHSLSERVFSACLDRGGSLVTVQVETYPELTPRADYKVRHIFRTVWSTNPAEDLAADKALKGMETVRKEPKAGAPAERTPRDAEIRYH